MKARSEEDRDRNDVGGVGEIQTHRIAKSSNFPLFVLLFVLLFVHSFVNTCIQSPSFYIPINLG